MKYAELINQSSESINANDISIKNEEANISIQQSLLTVRKGILRLETVLDDAKRAIPFDALNVIRILNGLDLAKRQLNQLETLKNELF